MLRRVDTGHFLILPIFNVVSVKMCMNVKEPLLQRLWKVVQTKSRSPIRLWLWNRGERRKGGGGREYILGLPAECVGSRVDTRFDFKSGCGLGMRCSAVGGAKA